MAITKESPTGLPGGLFRDRSALVTGGASGIGRATVIRLLREGARVLVFDLQAPEPGDLIDECGVAADRLSVVSGDVTSEADVERAFDRGVEEFGAIDLLFNNAGITGPTGPLFEHDRDRFREVVQVNLDGVWLALKAAANRMRLAQGGAIVNVASIGGVGACSGLIGYGASKAAVVNMTKTAAVELARFGIRVNAICPGPVDTPLLRRLEELRAPGKPAEGKRRILRPCPMKRYASPGEIANVVAFLLSDEASYVNGAIVPVDGGILAH